MFVMIPKGFFPTQDIGMMLGISEAGQDVSPQQDDGRSSASSPP